MKKGDIGGFAFAGFGKLSPHPTLKMGGILFTDRLLIALGINDVKIQEKARGSGGTSWTSKDQVGGGFFSVLFSAR